MQGLLSSSNLLDSMTYHSQKMLPGVNELVHIRQVPQLAVSTDMVRQQIRPRALADYAEILI